jgi:spermidine synthase
MFSVKATMQQVVSGVRVTTVLAGTITAGTQVVLLREILSAFLGNELVIGIMLFDWLALTGIGAVLARQWATTFRLSLIPPVVLGALLVLPPLTLAGFRLLPLLIAPPGSMMEIWIFLAGAILILSPVCLSSGAAFSLLVRAAASRGMVNPVGSVYAWEAAGSLTGGALFGVLLFEFFSSQNLLLCLCAGSGIAGSVIALRTREWLLGLLLSIGVVALGVGHSGFDVNKLMFTLRYPGHTILAHEETPYGELTTTRLGDQNTIFVNNIPLLFDGDIQSAEELVHFTLAQRAISGPVLVAGGNPSSLIPEVLKYPGARVDCIEENPWMRDMQQRYFRLPDDERVTYLSGDIRRHLRTTVGRYDAIIVVAPEPSTLQSNRFYTREAIQLAHCGLRPAGVLCLSLSSSAEYAGADAKNVRATLLNTIRESFGNVILLPAGRDMYLASDSTLRMDVAAAVADAGVVTKFANADYVQDDLLADRARRLNSALQMVTPVNSDDHPVLMLAQIRYWLRFFAVESWVPALVFLAALFFIVRTDRESLGVIVAGFGGITLELIALMIVQVGFGNVYKMSGALIGLYMAGMGIGAFAGGYLKLTSRRYTIMQCGLAVSLLASAFLQAATSEGAPAGVAGLVACLTLGSLCAGAVFTLTSRARLQDPVGNGARLYGADLLGSAIGALLVGPFLLPLVGVQAVADIGAAIVITGAGVSLTSPVWRSYEKT